MDTLQFFWKYPNIITLMINIYYHMKEKNYDYPVVICGEPGSGKSMFSLHFYELWYRVIREIEVDEEHIKNINAERMEWLRNFKTIKEFDVNIDDEAADGFSSIEAMTRFGRDIQKLYKINRKKKFLTPLIVLDFFELPAFFRKRARGVFWVHKQGKYKYYTKTGIKYLNAYNNNNKGIKSMDVARPMFNGVFPDYLGILRHAYDEKASCSADNMLDEMIENNDPEKQKPQKEKKLTKTQQIINGFNNGLTQNQLVKLGYDRGMVSRVKKELVVDC